MGTGKKKKKRSKNRRLRNSAKASELQEQILSWAYPSPDRVRRCLLVLLTLCVIAIGLISADRILPVEQVSYIVQGSRVETRHGKSTTHKVTLFRLINGQESFETELHTQKVLAGLRVEFQKTGLIGHRLAETVSRPVANGENRFVVFKEQKSTNILSPNQQPKPRLQDAIAASSGLASRLRCSAYRGYACAANLHRKPCPYCTCAFRSLFW